MCGPANLHRGGLIPAARLPLYDAALNPLRDGLDVSWLPHCLPGDDQGQDGACAIFALASWAEIMHRADIADAACLDLYAATLAHVGRSDGGLTFAEAFAAAHGAGWLPGARAIQRVSSLTAIAEQPLIAGYSVTAAWDNVSPSGCLDHAAPLQPVRGYHAVVVVAHGRLEDSDSGPWVYIENSWGRSWGWQGIGVMSEPLHVSLCNELWMLI